jgi:hypothetical protein
MSEVKNATVVGKIELKPRRVVNASEIKKINDNFKKQQGPARDPGPRRMKHADDKSALAAGNQQMLAELQYVKTRLRKAEEERDRVITAAAIVRLDIKKVLELVDGNAGLETVTVQSGSIPVFGEAFKAAIQPLRVFVG